MTKSELIAELENLRKEGELEAEGALSKLRKKAENQNKKMEKALDALRANVNEFNVPNFVEDEASVQEKYSFRFFENMMKILDSIQTPENITLKTLERYEESVKEAFVKIDEVSRKYVKLLDRSFQSRMRSLDRSYRRAIQELGKYDKFVKRKYAPDADIEGIVWIIDDIMDLIPRYYDLLDEIDDYQEDVEDKTKELDKLKEELEKIEGHPKQKEYNEVLEEYHVIQKKLDEYLSDVRKALRKYINKMSKQKNSGDLSLMKDIVSDVASTIANQASMNGIKSMLSEINQLLENNDLELKRERKEAAKDSINKLLEGELDEIAKNTKSVYERRFALKEELEKLDLEGQIAKMKDQILAVNRDRIRIIEREVREAKAVRQELDKELEAFASKFNKRLTTDLEEIPTFNLEID